MQSSVYRAAPGQLRLAARLMYAAAALSAAGLLAFPSSTSGVVTFGNPHTAAYQAGMVLGRILMAAVAAGLWLWMSWAVQRGKGWARVVSAVILLLGAEPAVAALLAHLWISAVLMTLAAVAGMAAIVLLCQRDCSLFFAHGWTPDGGGPPPGPAAAAGGGAAAVDGAGLAAEAVVADARPTVPAPTSRGSKLPVLAVGVVAAAIIAALVADLVAGSPKPSAAGSPKPSAAGSPKPSAAGSPKPSVASRAGSTASVRVIVPAPAEAGGLRRDYAAENTAAFQSAVAPIRSHYAHIMHTTRRKLAIAIYTSGPPGTPGAGSAVRLTYIGVNVPPGLSNEGTAVDLVAGAVAHLTNVSHRALRGGPGDTRYECATGLDHGQSVVVCGWSTDRSFGLLIQSTPGGTISELATLMMKMRPDLLRS